MTEPSQWTEITRANPEHSRSYLERFRAMEAEGRDLGGEARLVDAMAPREAHILDAGSGSGRVGGRLAAAGHTVVGVDGDKLLVEAAKTDYPNATWILGDLAELNLASHGIDYKFDVIVAAGNVMAFLAPSTRVEVLTRLGDHLALDGRTALGFGAGRGYEFNDFLADAERAHLEPDLLMSTWDMRPFTTDSNFLVAILRKR